MCYHFFVFKECPKRNGYFTKPDGGACCGRDELGLRLEKNPDDCQKACDENPDCISFEIDANYDGCNLSSTCTYDLAIQEERVLEKYGACLYVKEGHKTLSYQEIHFYTSKIKKKTIFFGFYV